MKTRIHAKKARKGFTLIELMVVIAILATLAGVAYGPIMRQMRAGDENQALQNGKQVVMALLAFNNEMNSYPSDRTAETLQRKQPDYDFGPLTGEYSNCYFRQLFYSQMDSEKNFYAKISSQFGETRNPDDEVAGGKALEAGENGFAYVMFGEGRAITSNVLNTPIIVTPVLESTPGDRVIFDSCFSEKGLVIRLDQSAAWIGLTDEGGDLTMPELFKTDKKGRETASRYFILAPEL